MKDKNAELLKKFFDLQKKLSDFGGDGNREALEWNDFVKTYSKDSILRIKSNEIDTINCYSSEHRWEFPCKVELSGKFQSVHFQGAKFKSDFDCQMTKFLKCNFTLAIFSETANFSRTTLPNNASFDGAIFEKEAYFLGATMSGEISLRGSKFMGEAVFAEIKFGAETDNSLLIDGAKFSDKVSLTNYSSESGGYQGILRKLSLNYTIFDSPAVINFKFGICPDFSKTYFIKKHFIEETWQIDEKEISAKDEPKFRFLKKYFAEQGNHFKEQQYFSYEMMAREDKLDKEGGSDWLLFKAYKNFSNFGMSSLLPFAWLCFFCSIFFIISLCFGCDGWSGLTISIIKIFKPFTEFECSAQSYSSSFVFSFEGFVEIFRIKNQPLEISNGLKIISVFQSVINTVFIFLIGLGLRNKFKIK